ncbi:hypothetical protein EDB86DRAFT_3062455 [Lactarius hatsudake]|nr:hypothetical protein EDB86DRAFT_3062455 [Lactarius hatsudake]
MDPAYQNKKIVDLSDEELNTLEFLGKNVAPGVKAMVEKVRADPVHLGTVTCFMVDCLNRRYSAQAPPQDAVSSPTSPSLSPFPRLQPSARPIPSTRSSMHYWYHGISGNPPKLMWPRFFKIPNKTAHGVFDTPLNAVWGTVAPQILESMKAHGLKYSALKTVRFSTVEDGKEETFGPVVVWIAVRPNTTNAGAVRDATPDILHILADFQITDVVVEWYEGSVERLAGPPLMSVEDNTSPRFGLNHPFNTGLGTPIARESDDAQGTLTFLFREVKTNYEFDGANPQHILVCGERRLARAVVEIEDAVNTGFRDAVRLAGELAELGLKSDGQNSTALRRKQNALDDKNEDNATLQTLFAEVKAKWQDTNGRRFGDVDWAPEISVRVDDRHYTRDIATFAVDGAKLENFERNIVDLGNQYGAGELEDRFWPIAALPIHRALPRRLVNNPDTEDKNGEPLYIVAKYGSTTKLTLGRYSGMEAYTCTDLGLEARDVVVYNYSKTSGDFSDHGDSGSLIFTGSGDGLAILHSGMPRGMNNHVTYGTPLWWVIKQILGKYPSAEFYGIAYTLD